MQFSQIKESCLYITDLDQAEAFYHGKLNLPIISKVPGRHIFFRAGTSVLLCFIAEVTAEETILPPHFASGKQHLAFSCPPQQYENWKTFIQDREIAIIHEHTWPGGFRSFYFHDPEGHVLEVVQEGMWGNG